MDACVLTPSCTKNPVMIGEMIPGIVAKVLEMPIKIEAYCGATSKWLTAKPLQAKAPKPTAIVMHTMLVTG